MVILQPYKHQLIPDPNECMFYPIIRYSERFAVRSKPVLFKVHTNATVLLCLGTRI